MRTIESTLKSLVTSLSSTLDEAGQAGDTGAKPAAPRGFPLPILALALAAFAIGTTEFVIMGLLPAMAHGSFFGIGAVLASELVAPDRKAGAIALMFTGLTLANVLGVPLGNLIGQEWGWRASFGAVAGLGIVAAIALVALLPKTKDADTAAQAGNDWSVLKRPQVLIALALTAVGFGGIFTAFTFIAPMLAEVTGLSTGWITGVLFLFGLGLTVGNTVGGKLADWKLMPSLMGVLVALAIVQALLAMVLDWQWPTIVTAFVWGMAAFATVPGLQMRMMQQAPDAPALVSTLNIAAFNLGNAGGAWLGGWMLTHGASLRSLPVAGSGLAVFGIGLAAISVLIERRAR